MKFFRTIVMSPDFLQFISFLSLHTDCLIDIEKVKTRTYLIAVLWNFCEINSDVMRLTSITLDPCLTGCQKGGSFVVFVPTVLTNLNASVHVIASPQVPIMVN